MAGPASASPRPQVWRFPTGRPEPKTSSLHRVQQGGAFRKAFGHKNSKADGLVFYTASQISQHIEVAGSDSAVVTGSVGNCVDWAGLRFQARSSERFWCASRVGKGFFRSLGLPRERLS